jgi:hypothetical protein
LTSNEWYASEVSFDIATSRWGQRSWNQAKLPLPPMMCTERLVSEQLAGPARASPP